MSDEMMWSMSSRGSVGSWGIFGNTELEVLVYKLNHSRLVDWTPCTYHVKVSQLVAYGGCVNVDILHHEPCDILELH
jgi:hypothetical protein